MVKCRYIFDIVIVSVSLPREEFAPEEVDVGVEFRDFKTTITPSRINITDFRDGYGYEYEEETDEVRSSLIPMSLTVNISQKPMGRGIYKFPEFVLGKIETMSEVQQLERIDLYDPDQPQEEEGEGEGEAAAIGSIDIFYRIQPKCQEDEDEEFDGNIEEMAEHLKKTLKENDLLYVIGEKKYLQSCAEDLQLDPPVQPDIALDLSKFRDMSGRLVPTPSILNTCCNPDCCGIQKAARRQAGASMQNKLTCGGINLMRQPKGKSKGKAKCLVCQPDFSSSDSEDESESCPDSENGIGDVQWGGLPRPRVCLNTPPPELTQAIPITPKCCPVCQTNIDWLPPLAVCPKCNYKPVPIMTEAPYNTNLSAAEILRDYMNRDRPSDPIVCRAAIHQVDDEDLDECGLALQSGNQCKSKRVRQACDNVFPRHKDQQTQAADCQDRKSAGRGGAPQQLMQVFDSMKQLFEEADQLQRKHGANQDKCRHLLNQGEEAELTRKMFEPIKNYQQSIAECSNIEKMNERLCFCKGNRGEEPETQGAPVKGNKKKHIVRIDCKYPCSIRKTVKKPNTDKPRPKNVPGHMGWLWKRDEHAKLGWKPGAVRRQIREIMAFFLPNYPPDTFKTGRPCPKPQQLDGTEKPTLYVCKRNDEYFVTLRPIVDISKCYNPCKQLKPIQFHIKKNPELVEIRKLRDDLLERGYAPCTCNMPVIKCHCRSDREKLQIMMVVMKECCRRGIGNCGERLVLNDENDSEAEFEVGVTPPAAMKRPFTCPLRLATNGTQYNLDDLNVRPKYPLAGDKTAKPYQCDIGEKYETKKGKKKLQSSILKQKEGKQAQNPQQKLRSNSEGQFYLVLWLV